MAQADGMFVMEGDEVAAVNGTLCEGAGWSWVETSSAPGNGMGEKRVEEAFSNVFERQII